MGFNYIYLTIFTGVEVSSANIESTFFCISGCACFYILLWGLIQ